MTRSAVCVASVAVLCLTVSGNAQADPIRITGGSLVFSGGGPLSLGTLSIVGTRGFSAQGRVSSGETFVGPAHCVPCPADSTISTGISILGAAFGGTVTLGGHTYTGVNSEPLVDHLYLLLEGMIHIPEWRNESVTVSAPFAATGIFSHNVGTPFLFEVPIKGSGTVTLNLAPEPTIGLWDVGLFRYDFVATPTPEPATLMLVTGGLVASTLRARTRRERRTGIQLSTSTQRA